MSKHHVTYNDFVDQIDLDAFEEAIGFEPFEHRNGEDVGHCLDLWGMHKHGDTTGKFAINRDKRVYHCFVCGGGTLLSLAMEATGFDEEAATDWLKTFTRGDIRTDADVLDAFRKIIHKQEEHKAERLPHFNEHVLTQFDAAPGADFGFLEKWCHKRGIDLWTMTECGIGYSPNHKKSAPFRDGEKIDDDYFGPCVVFPHVWMGQLVGWQHRWVDYPAKKSDNPNWPRWLPKYTNTSDFPASSTLYNYEYALKQKGPVIVVESSPTVLFLRSMGLNAVGTFGSKATDEQLRLLRRFGHVILAPDNDEPGRKFVEKAKPYLRRYVDLSVLPPVTLKPGADLNDYMDTDKPEEAVIAHLEKAKKDSIFRVKRAGNRR